MTNKEKFKEVFGLEIDDSADCGFFDCSGKLCKDCPVKETESWWNTEYMPPQNGTWVNMSYEAYVDLLSQTVKAQESEDNKAVDIMSKYQKIEEIISTPNRYGTWVEDCQKLEDIRKVVEDEKPAWICDNCEHKYGCMIYYNHNAHYPLKECKLFQQIT